MNDALIGDPSRGAAADGGGASIDAPGARGGSAEAGPVPGREPSADVPRDLALHPSPLAPSFPLESRGTSLVLSGGRAGHLSVFWHLTRDDFEYAASSFPASGARPVAMIRLQRGGRGGDAETVAERSLSPGVRQGAGEVPFETPLDHARYHAELGLSTPEGGWLMLSRSNGLYDTDGVGLDLPPRLDGEQPDGDRPGAPGEAARRPTDLLPASAPPGVDLPALVFPMVPPARAARLGAAAGPAPLTGPGTFLRVPGTRDWVEPALAGPPDPEGSVSGPILAPRAPIQRQIDALATPGTTLGPSGGPALEDRPARGVGDPAGGTRQAEADPLVAPRPRAPISPDGEPSRLEPPSYGVAPVRPGCVEIEAQLRIVGSAPPNQVLDLFGFPYRVGPGGRFQFVLPVEDLELLARALAARPPGALLKSRD